MLEPLAEAPLVVWAAGKTDVGRVRDHNEDTILLRPELNLYVLADGAGGHNAGEVASALAARAVVNFYEATEAAYRNRPEVDDFGLFSGARRLAAAVHKANRDVLSAGRSSSAHRGMGTTVVAAALSPKSGLLHLSHVGDSRCYRLRHGFLEQLTEDHSLLVDVLELRPDIDDETLGRLPTNVITRALGMDPSVRVPARTYDLAPGDRYLLCSDGLTNELCHQEICDGLAFAGAPDEIARRLVIGANRAGGADNVSVVVIACEQPQERSASERTSGLAAIRRTTEPPPPPGREESIPEILLIGVEEVDLEQGPIRVVPAESATPDLLEAVEQLIRPLRSRPPSQGMECRRCGQPVITPFCPECGAPCTDPQGE